MLSQTLRRIAEPSLIALNQPNLHLKVLSERNHQEVLQLLTQRFSQDEPITSAFYRLLSTPKSEIMNDWKVFWDSFSEDYLTNGISVGIFDSEKDEKLVGVSIAKDLTFAPKGFQETLKKVNKVFSGIIKMEDIMCSTIRPQYQTQMSTAGKVMDVWGVTIHKDYTGKQLLHKMMSANEILGKQKGFKYGFCYASNFKTGKGLQKLGYEKVAQIDAKNYKLDGFKYFQLLDMLNQRPSLWMKPLINHSILDHL